MQNISRVFATFGMLAACAKTAEPPSLLVDSGKPAVQGTADTATHESGTVGVTHDSATVPVDTGPFVLTGTLPPVALPAIDFTQVVNQDSQVRSKADLLGHPTVLWFYPAAATGG